MLLVGGGIRDPNLNCLAAAAARLEVDLLDYRHGSDAFPRLTWSIAPQAVLSLESVPAGAFLRYDVFNHLSDPRPAVSDRAAGWHQALQGWLLSRPDVKILNRNASAIAGNKIAMLNHAQRVGLRIPQTIVTNCRSAIESLEGSAYVAKPILGGGYCERLTSVLDSSECRCGALAVPGIVQNELVGPEVRVYVIGGEAFAFSLASESLDYRVQQDVNVTLLTEIPAEVAPLRLLMNDAGLDFGAADFKTDPNDRQLIFLEVNTSPMFARFDEVTHGELANAIVRSLVSVD
jgi:hypothetical protein